MLNKIDMRKDHKGRDLNPLICYSDEFINELLKEFDWFSGMPDSVFRKVINNLNPYIISSRENHALSMAFGARLGGAKPCVLMQNSGLGLSGDVIYGLFDLYKIGVVIIVSLRGELEWEEPQHQRWGSRTLEYLKVLGIKEFDMEKYGIDAINKAAEYAFNNEKPAAVIIHRGNIDE